ncbi:probable disease resistance protein At5g45440 [Rhododendron vialii]|uniref:probable disease resistance protein At5g45440 n=1 Tax=Rhododendron vialii TaxID=182163 RepID=UPI00265E7E79|nr:probable disease resistance protein At5g45440 [Rhododendron vialii]
MADQNQIEEYLVEKLKKTLEELARGEKHLPARLANLYKKFKDLKKSLGGPNQKVLKPREKLYKLDNLLSEWRIHSKKKNHYSWESLCFVRNYGKELKNIAKELDDTASTGGTGDLPASNGPVSRKEVEDFRWSDRFVDENKVHGIHDKAISLKKFLVSGRENNDRRFSMIGIVGMRGVGKTTLAQVVFNKPEVKKHFLPRIWVCASKQPEDDFDRRIEIVKRMLMCLGVEEKIIESARQHGLKGFLFALRLQLTGKRYLIVLDDVWCKEEMYEEFSTNFCSSLEADENKCSEKLAYGLPKGYGGAVIVTSRIEKLVIKMVGEENLHIVKPLKDPKDCWKIFKDSAGQIDEEVAEDQKAKTVEDTDSANGHVDQQEEDPIEVNSASANGHVDQQEKDQIEENSANSASANGHVDQQVQDQIEENSASANGQNSNIQEKEEEDPIEREFKELKEKIIEKCAGLPLAARMMGEIARESDHQRTRRVPAESPQREQQQVVENPGVPESTQSDEQHRQED